jgi:hypothetical protein
VGPAALAHHEFSMIPDGGPALEASWSHPTLNRAMTLPDTPLFVKTHDFTVWLIRQSLRCTRFMNVQRVVRNFSALPRLSCCRGRVSPTLFATETGSCHFRLYGGRDVP